MNILINFQGKDGAGPTIALEWAKGLKAIGCNVFAAISKNSNFTEWLELLTLDNIFWIQQHEDKNKFDFFIKTLKFALYERYKLKRKFQDIKFDFTFRTLYCHWSFLVDMSVKKDKIVMLCHDPISHSGEKKYVTFLHHKNVCQSDEVFVLTQSFIPLVHQNYGIPYEQIHYIPHGRMSMYKLKQDNKYKINFDNDKFNFLFFGRIEKYKGLHVLAEAYSILQKERDDISLLVVGSGDFAPYAEEFKTLKNSRVINRFIPDEEVGCFFDGPNIITILPYIDATQSGVIPIAYEYGSPVIASDIGGLREQLDDGRIGILFKCGNAQDLADKMKFLITNKAEYNKQVELMRNYLHQLDWDILAQRIIDNLN